MDIKEVNSTLNMSTRMMNKQCKKQKVVSQERKTCDSWEREDIEHELREIDDKKMTIQTEIDTLTKQLNTLAISEKHLS